MPQTIDNLKLTKHLTFWCNDLDLQKLEFFKTKWQQKYKFKITYSQILRIYLDILTNHADEIIENKLK